MEQYFYWSGVIVNAVFAAFILRAVYGVLTAKVSPDDLDKYQTELFGKRGR